MRGAKMAASVTATTGGASNNTRSAASRSTSSTRAIWREASSSEGLGGSGPVGSTSRFGTAVGWAGSGPVPSARMKFVKPSLLSSPNRVCRLARRRSQSTASTRAPLSAVTTARLARVVDLPSAGPALVTSTVRSTVSRLLNWRLVRSARYASAIGERGSRRVTSSAGPRLAGGGGGRRHGARGGARGARDHRQGGQPQVALDLGRGLQRVVQVLAGEGE